MVPYSRVPYSDLKRVPYSDLSNSLEQSNSCTVIYNRGGSIHLPADGSSRNVRILNDHDGNVHISRSDIFCDTCDKKFATQAAVNAHKQTNPYGCREHAKCYANRSEEYQHLQKTSHHFCLRPGCVKKGFDFGTSRKFLQHWNAWHRG